MTALPSPTVPAATKDGEALDWHSDPYQSARSTLLLANVGIQTFGRDRTCASLIGAQRPSSNRMIPTKPTWCRL